MPIKALVVDDSVLFRKTLSAALSDFPGVEVLGTAPSGDIALKKLAQTPANLVFLDVHMEGMDGIQALQRIRADHPNTLVVMVSGVSSRSADVTIRALELGAVDFIKKPDGKDLAANVAALQQEIRNVLRHVETRILTQGAGKIPASPLAVPVSTPLPRAAVNRGRLPDALSLLVVGVSTGGPEALTRLLPELSADFPLPILVVQHMPPHFTRSLAESLSRKTKFPVREAEEGDAIIPGRALLAPGGRHLVVRRQAGRLLASLNSDPPENSCRPSVDVLFRSVAETCGDQGVLSVIMTGMGSDGQKGVEALKGRKGYVLTQSEATCVVYGMPKSVDDAGLSDESVGLDRLASRIQEIVRSLRITPV